MLQEITEDIWHVQHSFAAGGLPVTSRMTIVRLPGRRLWLHSPVPMSSSVRAQLLELGTVSFIVAPSKTHHLFLAECAAAFPDAKVFGAPGLKAKRQDMPSLVELSASENPFWQPYLEHVLFDGIPVGNETVWFHTPSRTLILTDLCQWWQGDIPVLARLYASLTGVRRQLGVPRTIRWMVRDRHAAQSSAARILEWQFDRVVTAHNAIVENDAHEAVSRAFECFK